MNVTDVVNIFIGTLIYYLCIKLNIIFYFRDHFYQYGEINSVTVVVKQSYAFIQLTQHDAPEHAAK